MVDFLALGQSGYSIRLLLQGDRYVVRKEANLHDKEGSDRLELQYRKHKWAYETKLMAPLLVPAVTDPFSNGGYAMTFAPGRPLGHALEVMSQKEIGLVSESICAFLLNQLGHLGNDTINGKAEVKLSKLMDHYLKTSDPASSELGVASIEQLMSFFSRTEIRSSPNHGDFSFDNILSDRRGATLYAIDFLDSPFDTVLLDAGRIWLDLRVGWWARRGAPGASSSINMARLRNDISRVLQNSGLEQSVLERFATFAALRVLPYTKQPFRKALLKNLLRQQLEETR